MVMKKKSVRHQVIPMQDQDEKVWNHPNSFLTAAKAKNDNLCEKLITRGFDVNYKDDNGCTALHVVAKTYSSKDILKSRVPSLLLQSGADVNAKDIEGNTPLHIAAKEHLLDLCRLMMQHVHDDGKPLKLDEQNDSHLTPLHMAAANGFWKIVKWLLDNHADPNLTNSEKWVALHFAAEAGHMKCCELLAPYYKYDPTAEFTPVMLAAKNGNRGCLELMKDVKLNLNHTDSKGNTAVHLVAATVYDKTLTHLLNLNVNLDMPNEANNTPLMVAVQRKQILCVKALCVAGANINKIDKQKKNVLHTVASTTALECLEYLLTHEELKKVIDKQDNNKMTPLAIAVKGGNEKMVDMLLDHKASQTVKVGHQDQSLLHLAAQNQKANLLLRLLSHKEVSINYKDKEKKTALHVAAESGSREVCLWLLRKGVAKDEADWHGKTALHYAAFHGHRAILQLLIKKGANVFVQDEFRNTALHIATQKGNVECCNDLVDANYRLLFQNNKKELTPLMIALRSRHIELIRFYMDCLPYTDVDQMSLSLQKALHTHTHNALANRNRELLCIIVESKWWEVGFISCKPEAKTSRPPPQTTTTTVHHSTQGQQLRSVCSNFRELVKLYPHLAAVVMDKCIIKSQKNPNLTEYDCRLLEDNYYMEDEKSPFTTENTLKPEANEVIQSAAEWKREHPLTYMIEYKCHALLKHPLVEAWLIFKWQAYAKWIVYSLLFLRAVSVAVFSSFVLIEKDWKQINNSMSSTDGEDGEAMCGHNDKDGVVDCISTTQNPSLFTSPTTLPLSILVFIFLVLQAAIEVNNICKLRSEYREKVFLLTGIHIVLTSISLVPVSCGSSESNGSTFLCWSSLWAMVLGWFLLIYNVNLLPSFCILSTLTWTFLKRFAKGFLIMVMVMLMFGLVFHVLLGSRVGFTSVVQSMVMMVVWLLGEYNYTDTYLDNPQPHYPLLTNVMLFMFICSVFTLFVQLISNPRMEESELSYLKNARWANLQLTIDRCYLWDKCRRRKVLSKISNSTEVFSVLRVVNGGLGRIFTVFHRCMIDDIKYTSGLEEIQDTINVEPRQLEKELQEQAKQLQEVLGVCNKLMDTCQKLNEQFVEINLRLKQLSGPSVASSQIKMGKD